jgi:putative transposase
MENLEIMHNLLENLQAPNLKTQYVQNQIPTKTIKEFKSEISNNLSDSEASKELTIKRLKRTINKENTEDKRKISKAKAQNLTLNLMKYFNIPVSENLIKSPQKLKQIFENDEKFDKIFPNCLKFEKRIVIIIDNFSVHKTYLSRIICKILNIKLIYLPKYSPFLNPIEQLWRTMKNIIHRNPIKDIDYLKEQVHEIFNEEVDKVSFFEKWNTNYIAKN